MPYGEYDTDPLDYEKAPSLSFKNMPIGTTYVGRVMGPVSLVQSRDFETGEPATWPDGNPKMAAVVRLEVNSEPRSLWAAKPSAMFAALVAAQKEAGQRIGEGGTLHVRYTGEEPNKNARLNATKQYACKYVPPVHDAFADAPETIPASNPKMHQAISNIRQGQPIGATRMPLDASTTPKAGW